MTDFIVPNIRAASAGTIALAMVLFAACSGGDPEPTKKSPSDVPSGTVVFRRFLDAQQSQAALFTMATDGKDERQITQPPEDAIDSFPDWSPDGKQIVFHREFTDKPYEVHIVQADGSGEHQVDHGRPPTGSADQINEAYEPAWSPDGKSVAFSWAFGELVRDCR